MIFEPREIQELKTIEPKGRKYFVFAQRETCLMRDEAWITWITDRGLDSFIDYPTGKIYEYWLHEKSALKALKRYAHWMRKNWAQHLGDYPEKKAALLLASAHLAQTIATKDNAIISDAYRIYIQRAYEWGDYIWGAWAVIYCIEPELIKKIPEKINVVTALDQPIELQKMRHALLKRPAEEVAEEYSWLSVYSPYDRDFRARDLKHYASRRAKGETREQFGQIRAAKKNFQNLMRSKLKARIKLDCEIVHTYAFLKTDRVDVWRQTMALLKPLCAYVARSQKGWTIRNVSNLSAHEIITWLESKKLPSRSKIKLRSKGLAGYHFTPTRIDITYSKIAIERLGKRLMPKHATGQEVRGVTASPGVAQGTIKIIEHSDDLTKIEVGDIFVARYTFPTFTPYMQKAAAIVTDEGGITSHAAIVSREINKPCIVGTKIATKIFKDGDVVIVDAERGIVQKIS